MDLRSRRRTQCSSARAVIRTGRGTKISQQQTRVKESEPRNLCYPLIMKIRVTIVLGITDGNDLHTLVTPLPAVCHVKARGLARAIRVRGTPSRARRVVRPP